VRLAFLGTPEFVVPVLEALHGRHEIVQVVSRADRRRSRRGGLEPSPVKQAAMDLGLPVSARPADVVSAGAEIGVVVAFGRIIKPDVLASVPMVNLHLSLLPRWRGAAPVQRAILSGDAETGVSLMQLDEGLDTGPVYAQVSTVIDRSDTAESLTRRLIDLGLPLLDRLDGDMGQPVPQSGEATYAEKITKADLRLDWDAPAEVLLRRVRVGGAWTVFRDQRLAVVRAGVQPGEAAPGVMERTPDGIAVGTGEAVLVIQRVKPEGRNEQAASDWWNGSRVAAGERLG
jgi:methionyl-tRNA formyltransferase